MFIVNLYDPINEEQLLSNATLEYESSIDFLLENNCGVGREQRGQLLTKLDREGTIKITHSPENVKWHDIEVTSVRVTPYLERKTWLLTHE